MLVIGLLYRIFGTIRRTGL